MTLSRIFGILALVATALTTLGTLLNAIAPKYAVYALALSAAISAFTGRVQGKPDDDLTVRRNGL